MGPTGRPEASVKNYHYTLHNVPEEDRSYIPRGRILLSRKVNFVSGSIQRYKTFYRTKMYAVLLKLIFKFNRFVRKWNFIFISHSTEHNLSVNFTPLQVNCFTSMSDPLVSKRWTISMSAAL